MLSFTFEVRNNANKSFFSEPFSELFFSDYLWMDYAKNDHQNVEKLCFSLS